MQDKNGYSQLNIRLDEDTAKIIDDLVTLTGLPKKEILAYSSQPCGPCGNDPVRVRGKNDQIVDIPRGLLFKSMLTKHSGYQKKIK